MRRVGLLLPNRFPGLPSYRLPDDAGEAVIGARVAAPFGSALVTGLVAELDPPPVPEGTAERDVVAVLGQHVHAVTADRRSPQAHRGPGNRQFGDGVAFDDAGPV